MKWPGWTGVGERIYEQPSGTVVQPSKTAWDWLQLLIVPAFLVGAVTFYNASQTAAQNRRSSSQTAAQNRQSIRTAQDTTLNAYFLQMSDLMLNNKLLSAVPGSAVRAVGDAITSAAIGRLDMARQTEVVRFLSEAHVVGANLVGASLPGAHLFEASLRNAHLEGVDLKGADLEHANLYRADLQGANLDGADFSDANLKGANLKGAKLERANLESARAEGADFVSATLKRADLAHANLTGAEFTHAAFQDTVCPNGTITNTGC